MQKIQPKLIVKIEEVSKLYDIQLNQLSELKESGNYPLYDKLYKKYYYERRFYKSDFKIIYFILLIKRISPTLSWKERRIGFAKFKKQKKDISNLESEMKRTKYLLDQLKEDNNNINNYFENVEV